jgi:uncharacterized membrane protein YfcA
VLQEPAKLSICWLAALNYTVFGHNRELLITILSQLFCGHYRWFDRSWRSLAHHPNVNFCFQIPASIAISSDVVAATLMKVVGGFKHWQQKTLDLQVVKWLALGSVPGSLTGVWILHCIQSSGNQDLDSILLRFLGVAIALIVALSLTQLVVKTFFPNFKLPSPREWDLNTNYGRICTVSAAAILGCIVGITSVSSGSMFALLLIAFFRLDTSKLVGTDISQAAILLMFTSVGHLSLGTVNWGLVLPIWLGSVPGVLVGAKLCQIMPQRPLKFVIYGMLAMASWKLYQV